MPRLRVVSSGTMLAGGAIVLAALAAYHNSFSGPFVFDDIDAIRDNPSIRHLWPIWAAFSPPSGGLTVSGRPVLNFTLAINYALGGTNVWGYHAVNLLIHILAGLTLFGIVRRTLESSRSRKTLAVGPQTQIGRPAPDDQSLTTSAAFLAFAIALLWTVHPLQTESVTYIVQRAESLMGLFYLLTLYCFIRSVEPLVVGRRVPATPSVHNSGGDEGVAGTRRPTSFLFAGLSFLACLLGMATKEVMVSAPVIVFLYDRTFVSGTFREAWRRHRRLHAALASTWLLLAYLVVSNHDRGGTSGFASGISWSRYTLTQIPAVVNYLWLAVKPYPLVFDYATEWVPSVWSILPQVLIVGLLIAGTVKEIRISKFEFRNFIGFSGFFFFSILAPTSLVAGGRQTMAEHRMYLALAPVIAVVVFGVSRIASRVSRRGQVDDIAARCNIIDLTPSIRPDEGRRGVPAAFSHGNAAGRRVYLIICGTPLLAVALVFIFLTIHRNEVYRSDLSLWQDTTAKRPGNAFALTNLGVALLATGRTAEATALFEKSRRLDPFEFEAEYNLGFALASTGHAAEAMAHYRRTIEIKPDLYKARNNLGVLLTHAGRLTEAIGQFEAALRTKPDFADAHIDLGIALAAAGRTPEAIAQYDDALRSDPDSPEAHGNLGNALKQAGRIPEAVTHYERAIRLKPDYAEAHNNLGVVLSEMGRLPEAVGQYEQALKFKPGFADAHENLGTTLVQMNRLPEAAAQFGAAVRSEPSNASAHNALGGVLSQLGRTSEAIPQYEEALRLNPDYPQARANLGVALASSGRMAEAIVQLSRAVQLKPDYAEAQSNLAVALAASGRLEEAIFHYEEAVRIQPDNADIRTNYAAALAEAGRTEEARAQWAEAARLEGKHEILKRNFPLSDTGAF